MKTLNQLRKRMVEIDYKYKNNHLASALSALPIIKDIYEDFDFDNDKFILSKGHGSLALYAVLEDYGYNPDVSKIHPDIDIKNGISCTTGSLGHGLPIAVGMAMAKKHKNKKGLVSVLLGDGECQEGTTWESLLVADKYKLDNLKVHIDDNMYQALEETLYPTSYYLERVFPVKIHRCIKGYGIKLFQDNPNLHVYELTNNDYKQIMEELS